MLCVVVYCRKCMSASDVGDRGVAAAVDAANEQGRRLSIVLGHITKLYFSNLNLIVHV